MRPRRIIFNDPEQGAYHIISRAIQKEYRLNDEEKMKFLSLLQWLSKVYFVRVATFSLMTTHFHLVIKMIRKDAISEAELRRRFDLYYNRYATEKTYRELAPREIPAYYARFSNVSCFMQDLKQRFSRWYNEVHRGFGHVWAERFTSVLLVGARALRVCMLYVELNALRAGLVREPEKYSFCGLHHYLAGGRRSSWLDHKLLREAVESFENDILSLQRSESPEGTGNLVHRYLALVYQEGMNLRKGKASISERVWEEKVRELPEEVRSSIYMSRLPMMTHGIVLGAKEECESLYNEHRACFKSKSVREANPVLKKEDEKEEGRSSPLRKGLSIQELNIMELYSFQPSLGYRRK